MHAANIRAALDLANLLHGDPPTVCGLVVGLIVPKIKAVDPLMREPEAALMRMVLGLAFHRLHWKVARNDHARRGPQRVQIRLHRLSATEDEIREWFAVDFNA